jgi:RNA polymerase sigma factor (TIGR02999 family)
MLAMTDSNIDLTDQLQRWKAGDKAAESVLIDALYPILKRSARSALGKCAPGRLSLSATELVHETYLRLIQQRKGFENRAHFLAIAAHTLKRVILDLLKARSRGKRGDAREVISLDAIDDALQSSNDQPLDLIGFVQQLESLSRRDPLAAQALELRLLGGLSADEAAEVMGVSLATAGRHFAFARAWLQQ